MIGSQVDWLDDRCLEPGGRWGSILGAGAILHEESLANYSVTWKCMFLHRKEKLHENKWLFDMHNN